MSNLVKSNDWLERHHKGTKIIHKVIWQLETLANSFYNVGNSVVAQDLKDFAELLEVAQKTIDSAIGDCITKNLKYVEEMSGTILKAALAGCLVSKKEK